MSIVHRRAAKSHNTALRLLTLLGLSLALCGCSLLPTPPTSAQAPTARVATTASAMPPPATQATPLLTQPIDGFDAITSDQLPPQARQTLALIAHGGPFPYRQDGQVFQNRERRLPRHPSGYYHEYTVETPGSDDRGARRIITGAAGEIFYTADHYASFVQVLPQ
jgi:ribonuclease T1